MDAPAASPASRTVGPDELRTRLRAALADAGDADRALGQQAYMKSAMPYFGVTTPQLRVLQREVLSDFHPERREEWEETVRVLWDRATHREERYAAIGVAGHRVARRWQDPDALDLYAHLIVTGAWWDLVDGVAGDLVGGVLRGYRAEVTPVIRRWAVADDLWLRRAAVLSQLKHGSDTDLGLLSYIVESNVDDGSFWLRKAIGWALRQYARTDPDWVRAEAARLGERLSGLSRREALKHLG